MGSGGMDLGGFQVGVGVHERALQYASTETIAELLGTTSLPVFCSAYSQCAQGTGEYWTELSFFLHVVFGRLGAHQLQQPVYMAHQSRT